jgi:hypothetical protein
MMIKGIRKRMLFGLALLAGCLAGPTGAQASAGDAIRSWNRIAIDTSGLDHTAVTRGESRVFGEQLDPGRSSCAMATVHIAIFDAVNAIAGGYLSYSGLAPARSDTSVEAAVAQAAHDTLVALYPSHQPRLDKTEGIAQGRRVADYVYQHAFVPVQQTVRR